MTSVFSFSGIIVYEKTMGERRQNFLVEGLQVHGHLPAFDFSV